MNSTRATAVSAASSTMVFLLLQNPYSQATTNVAGNPISEAFRRIRSDVTSVLVSPRAVRSFVRFVGNQSWKPNVMKPRAKAKTMSARDRPPNGRSKSWVNRLLTRCSTCWNSVTSTSTTWAP